MHPNLLQLLIELETSLHSETVRKSKDKLSELLHGEFIEIGASGKVYDKNHIIESLPKESALKLRATDFKLRELSPEIQQLTYNLESSTGGNSTRYTLRSSLWKNNNDKWQIIFHQGAALSKNEQKL